MVILVTCIVCGQLSPMEGDIEELGDERIFYAHNFKCDQCELYLEDSEEIKLAGMQVSYTLYNPFEFRALPILACGFNPLRMLQFELKQ